MATGYHYRPLKANQKEIRLLRARPTSFRTNQLLDFRLEHHTFIEGENVPNYNAISYVWGDQARRKNIYVDGKLVSVPENAEIALRNLHKVLTTPSPKGMNVEHMARPTSWKQRVNHRFTRRSYWYWLDAICIDQFNLTERAEQVSIMWAIYTGANAVLIWLGADDDTTATAIEGLSNVREHCRMATDNFKLLEECMFQVLDNGTKRMQIRVTKFTKCDWTAIKSLFSASWFERVWIIQETALAHQAFCIRGEHIISWKQMSLACQWMTYLGYWDHDNMGLRLPGIDNVVRIHTWQNEGATMFGLLSECHRFKSTDPRDKVFGVLGLLQAQRAVPNERDFLDRTPMLRPDYCAATREIFTTAIRKALDGEGNLGILSLAQIYAYATETDGTLEGWPSWVPALHLSAVDENTNWFIGTPPLKFASPGAGCSDGIPLSLEQQTDESSILAVEGICVDDVAVCAELVTRQLWEPVQRMKELILRCVELIHLYGWDTDMALACTLTLGGNARLQIRCDIMEAWSSFLNWCYGNVDQRDYPAVAFGYTFFNSALHRHFFLTRTGLMGMGARGMQEGDVVCILFGSRVPFILRRTGDDSDCWHLIGDAYVYGMMDGEEIQGLKEEGTLESKKQWFRIC